MNTGLESATLWALQLGAAGVALIVMVLLITVTTAFAMWCILRVKYLLENDINRLRTVQKLERSFKD